MNIKPILSDKKHLITLVFSCALAISILIALPIMTPKATNAQRGCCSYHGGESNSYDIRSGKRICMDGTISPSCQVASPHRGCTNFSALNYDNNAGIDDGSCILRVNGCLDKGAINYNSKANTKDGSCQYTKQIQVDEFVQFVNKYIDNHELIVGEEKVIKDGVNGVKSVTYTITTNESEIEVARKWESEVVTTQPTPQEISKGTMSLAEYYLGVTKRNLKNNYLLYSVICAGIIGIIVYKNRKRLLALLNHKKT